MNSRMKLRRWWLSGTKRENASLLLQQQLYLIGRDIQSKHGNLLEAFGCRKEPSPYRNIPSIYSYWSSRHRYLVLRGFGVFCGDARLGGVILRRQEFRVLTTNEWKLPTLPWVPELLPRGRRPRNSDERMAAANLLDWLIRWFIDYETWIELELGRSYRIGQLSHINRRTSIVPNWNPRRGWQQVASWFS